MTPDEVSSHLVVLRDAERAFRDMLAEGGDMAVAYDRDVAPLVTDDSVVPRLYTTIFALVYSVQLYVGRFTTDGAGLGFVWNTDARRWER